MKNFWSEKICLIFFDKTDKRAIGKTKDEFGGIIATEFVGLKSKMYSIKKINDKELDTAKGVNIATEFNDLKMFYLIKKLLGIKWREDKLKSIK